MRPALRKLKSKRGASILLALLFFLFCAVIGSIVLFTAYSNAGRLTHIKAPHQDYLTVSSAVKLVRDEIDGQRYTIVKTVVDNGSPSYAYTPASGALGTELSAWTRFWFDTSPGHAPEGSLTISSDLEEVEGQFSMDLSYGIKATFSLQDAEGERQQMTLLMPATQHVSSVTTTREYDVQTGTDENGDPIMSTRTEVTVTTTTVIQWGNPSIVRGVA